MSIRESRAKRARVDETSQSSSASGKSDDTSNRMDISSEEATGNREEADFQILRREESDADDNDHNYSITSRWRKRCQKWEQWQSDSNIVDDNFDLNSLQLLTGDELFLTIDNSSLLGEKLVDFAEAVQESKDKVRSWEEEIASLEADLEPLEADLEPLEAELEHLEAELETLNEQNPSLTSSAPQPYMARLLQLTKSSIADKKTIIADKKTIIADKKTIIEANKTIIAKQVEHVTRSSNEVKTLIKEIFSAHVAMRNKLSYVKSKGNESVLTITSKLESLDVTRFDTSKLSSPSEFDDFLPKPCPNFTDGLIKGVNDNEKTKLCSFRSFVVDLFKDATKTHDREQVKNTTNALRDWKPDATVDKSKQYARPPTDEDKETAADHPILHAVICRIIGIIAETRVNSGSNDEEPALHRHERGVTTEQSVAGSTILNTKDRRIDVTADQRKEHLPVVLATMVQKAIEIKTGPDSKGKFNKAVEKGRSQVVGHLGKRLQYAFDLGGAGNKDFAVGVCLTPLSIEVMKMSLSGVGTTQVALEVIGTGCVPLLGKEHLTKKQESAFVPASLETNGFFLLAGALKYDIPRECGDTDGASFRQVRPMEEDLRLLYLGSGAFSNVFRLKPGEFMKMPKSAPLERILIHEAAILRKLRSREESTFIPKPVVDEDEGVSTIQAVIRGEISNVPCLRLSGVVGLPLDNLPRETWNGHAKSIIETVYDALKYAHSMSVYHLDVQPGNIIVKDEGRCTMLSDWGCSVDGSKTNSLKSFRGCTPYAHDRLLGKKSNFRIRLDSDLDFASLAYTVDHVQTGRLRWIFEFDRPPNVDSSDLEIRRNFVQKWLEKDEHLGLEKEVLNAMRSACHRRRSERTNTRVKHPE